jgi:hypothetical protein
LTEGGVVSATTFGQGNAGAITINASGTISADGEGTIFANVETKAIAVPIKIRTSH